MAGHEQYRTRTILLTPVIKNSVNPSQGGNRCCHGDEARLAEGLGLARAIGLDIVHSQIVTIRSPRPATLLGGGQIDQLRPLVEADNIGLLIIDHALTPIQQRNLERELDLKVLDRTGLILEIFGERARTREGRLQVELAHLNYQKSRLVRSWTHLERQRGGFGFLGGPGETQLEADRRQLDERIRRLEKDLARVRRTRQLHRQRRKAAPWPVVALVGYTNAGKSTLFNKLTGADVMVRDMLFATLDPTMREVDIAGFGKVIMSDTVGFVSDLPTSLVAAFRATLEEVLEADLLLHVRDISSPDHLAQKHDVLAVLEELGVETGEEGKILEIWNKIDRLDENEKTAIVNEARRARHPRAVAVSSLTGEGMDELKGRIEALLTRDFMALSIDIAPEDGALVNWLLENALLVSRQMDEESGFARLEMRMSPKVHGQLARRLTGTRSKIV